MEAVPNIFWFPFLKMEVIMSSHWDPPGSIQPSYLVQPNQTLILEVRFSSKAGEVPETLESKLGGRL